MANENYNTNELVSDEDVVIAELDEVTWKRHDIELEAEADTVALDELEAVGPDRQERVSQLRSDLQERMQTIGQLQFDVEQLRSKSMGLETEIKAREDITDKLIEDHDVRHARTEQSRGRHGPVFLVELRVRRHVDRQHRSVRSFHRDHAAEKSLVGGLQ